MTQHGLSSKSWPLSTLPGGTAYFALPEEPPFEGKATLPLVLRPNFAAPAVADDADDDMVDDEEEEDFSVPIEIPCFGSKLGGNKFVASHNRLLALAVCCERALVCAA